MMTWGIFHRCDICAANVKIALLSDHQRRLIIKLHQVLDEQYTNNAKNFSVIIPQSACECCLLKLEWLLNNLGNNLSISLQHSHGNMQKDPHEPESSEVKDKPPNGQPHVYNCDCHECQIKFGSLPLLVQVIECQEKSSQEQSASTPSTSQSNINTNKTTAGSSSVSLSEPSTSYASTSSPKKTMTCPDCNKSFTHRGDLNKHVRKHTGEQPYTCHICKRKFAHTSNLNRHLKVHSGDRPFVCSVCNKNFSRKDKLDMHKKTKVCKKFSEQM